MHVEDGDNPLTKFCFYGASKAVEGRLRGPSSRFQEIIEAGG